MQAQRVCLCVSGCVCVCVRWLLQLKCEMMPSVATMFVMLLLCYVKMKAVCVCVFPHAHLKPARHTSRVSLYYAEQDFQLQIQSSDGPLSCAARISDLVT